MQLLKEKVETHFLAKIRGQELRPGDRLPSVANITTELQVGYVTAAKAIKRLAELGYIDACPGRGSFVTDKAQKEAALQQVRRPRILFLCPRDHGGSPAEVYLAIHDGLEKRARQEHCDVTFRSLDPAEHDLLAPGQEVPAAVVFTHGPLYDRCGLERLRRQGALIVYCGLGHDRRDFASVSVDNYTGGREAAEYLLKQGHTRTAYVGTVSTAWEIRDELRHQAFRHAWERSGLELPPALAWHVDRHQEEVLAVFDQVRRGEPQAPTALFVTNDIMAAEIVRLAGTQGVAVPRDLSVLGFGNYDCAAQTVPGLTTMAYDRSELGRQAMRLIEDLLAHPEGGPVQLILPVRLIERGSVAAPRG